MADFCRQCSLVNWGQDFEDLAGITTPENMLEDNFAVVLCEGCGPIQVDANGLCVSPDCLVDHETGKERIR